MGSFLISGLDASVSLFYPNLCQICESHRATPQEGFVCSSCRDTVQVISPPFCQRCGLPYPGDITVDFVCGNCHDLELHFEWARAAVAASGVMLDVIHHYKYNRALWFEPFLAGFLVRHAAPNLSPNDWDWIVPVPLHGVKKREREFNQAERLAQHLSAATTIPIHGKLLQRTAPTQTQTLLSRRDRSSNVQRAFDFLPHEPLEGQRILLVDDVLTTGATTSACAKVLRQNGSGPVAVWTVARGL